MAIQKRITVSGLSMVVVSRETDGEQVLTGVIEANEEVRPEDEPISWTITLPAMTPFQFQCLAKTLQEIGDLAEDNPEALGVENNFIVTI